jgi:hypothetical protein
MPSAFAPGGQGASVPFLSHPCPFVNGGEMPIESRSGLVILLIA